MTEPARYKDFTKEKNKEPVAFGLDGDTFYCAPKLPIPTIKKVSEMRDMKDKEQLSGDRLERLLDILRGIMLDESTELFNKRIDDKTRPIDIEEISDIIAWLLEVYGLRPFQESSDSVDGSSISNTENVGISLTDGAPVLESIPTTSPQIAS